MYSVETDAELAQLRAASQTRKLTDAEQKRAIELVRAGRVSASYASSGAKAKKAADPSAVLEKLQGLLGGTK